jgi:hypothetical protein
LLDDADDVVVQAEIVVARVSFMLHTWVPWTTFSYREHLNKN